MLSSRKIAGALAALLVVGLLTGGNQASAQSQPTTVDTPLRVMAFNIFLGGTNNGGEKNLEKLIEFLRRQNPDVLFVVETYGSAGARSKRD